MNRKHSFVEDNWYHLYNRGVNKMDIFKNESDYSRFLELLYLANSTEPIDMQKLLREGLTFTDIMK